MKKLAHPLPLAAVLVLALNDHVFKVLWPGAVTGKLSDVAGMFFFPLLLSVALPSAELCVALTGAVFAALKLWPAFNAAVAVVWGPNALDPTDLWALFALVPSWLWLRRRDLPAARRSLQVAAVVASGVASLATTRLPNGPDFHFRQQFQPGVLDADNPGEFDPEHSDTFYVSIRFELREAGALRIWFSSVSNPQAKLDVDLFSDGNVPVGTTANQPVKQMYVDELTPGTYYAVVHQSWRSGVKTRFTLRVQFERGMRHVE